MPDMLHYIAVFTIDGVEHTMRGYTASAAACKKHVQQIIDARNANPDMEHEITELKKIVVGIPANEADKLEQEVKDRNFNGTVATEIFPGEPARLLHSPVTPRDHF